jgi:hypothetical protein
VVIGHKDGTLEVSWGGGRCSNLRARGRTRVGTIAGVAFRAVVGVGGEVQMDVAL